MLFHNIPIRTREFSMEPMITVALNAARKGALALEKATQHHGPQMIELKSRNDYVTEVDRAVEKEVIYHLRKAYPTHSFRGEECGLIEGEDKESEWIIDPIDGTTNFINGLPHFAISIAYAHKGKLQHAVILDPSKQEEFTASRGKGAMLNDRRIRVTQRPSLEGALIATGIPFNGDSLKNIAAYLDTLKEIAGQTSGIRRMGAASLDLAYVAAGRYDGFWEMNLQPWDVAAGILLIQEAGGFTSDFRGGNSMLDSGNLVCGSPKVFKPLLQIVGKKMGHIGQ
jgi:myo-inositol-1(or 4)-monophosphatase